MNQQIDPGTAPAASGPLAGAFEDLRAGRLDAARAAFADKMHDPQCGVDAHRGLASVAWQQNQPDTAIQLLKLAVRERPEHADAVAELALLLTLCGRFADSLEHWDRRLRLRPGDALAWHNYGRALASAGQIDAAVRAFERAIEIDPSQARTHETYARVLMEARRVDAAEGVWRRAREKFPQASSMALGLAELLFSQARLRECLDLYRETAAAMPDVPELRLGYGQLLEDFGDRDGAAREFRQALALRPGWALPVEALLTLLRKDARDEDLAVARAILDDPARPVMDHANAGFGLGKALEARGDYEGAFQAWTRANRARRQQIGPLDRDALVARVDRSIRQFSRDFLDARRDWGLPDPRPVFVLGMPRSGTTLVEQILSAHPDVEGCGELTELGDVARALAEGARTALSWPEAAGVLDVAAVRRGAEAYLAGVLRKHPTQAARLVDKAPNNFFNIGLIALLFPRARIIWCRRDPRDICTSIYSENFGLSQRHATDLADIGFFYRQHLRLMRHWTAVTGPQLIDCRYEELIADPEAHSRRLVEALGLPWDARCLKFHEDNRPVLTPSRWQVRSPIYRAAAGRWKRYERHLGPLLAELGDALDD